jgi:hypothetical protein
MRSAFKPVQIRFGKSLGSANRPFLQHPHFPCNDPLLFVIPSDCLNCQVATDATKQPPLPPATALSPQQPPLLPETALSLQLPSPICHPERTRISYLAALTATSYVVLLKENHMQLTEAAALDRKSGEAEGSAVRHSCAPPLPARTYASHRILMETPTSPLSFTSSPRNRRSLGFASRISCGTRSHLHRTSLPRW